MPPATLDRLIKRVAQDALKGVPVWVWEQVAPKDVVALTYHIVTDDDLPHQKLYAYKNRRQFENDVIHARANTVGYHEVANHRRRSARLPPNRVLFTFDDGLAECFHVVRPILLRHSVPAIFFVNTNFLDDREVFFETTLSRCLGRLEELGEREASRLVAALEPGAHASAGRPISNPMLGQNRLSAARIALPDTRAHRDLALWLLGFEEDGREDIARAWELLRPPATADAPRPVCMTTAEVRQLASEGFTIGSHGQTHIPLQRLDSAAMEEQIVSSCQAVRALTGQLRVPFAFPYSGRGIDRRVLADILRRNPFIELLFDTQDFCRDEEFMVQRICADPPPRDGGPATNLPFLLRNAWARRSAWYRARP